MAFQADRSHFFEVPDMTAVAAPDQETHSIETAGLRGRMSRHRIVAGMASGFLLWTSFPPVEWSWLAWIALAPLFWLATLRGHRFKTYLAAWAGGLVFWLLAVEWVRMTDPSAWLGWFLMALIFSIWWPGFLALLRWAVFRLQVPLILAAPLIWVGLEYIRAYFLSGFPWYYLAHSQYRRLYLIQIADLTGSLGISLLIVVFNALLVDLLTLPLLHVSKRGTRLCRRQNVRLCLVTILLGTTLCYGALRVSTAGFRDGPRLALLQSNIEQRHKARGDPSLIIAEFVELVSRAIAGEPPDLIVWPETAYPYGYIAIDPTVDPRTLEGQVRSISAKLTVRDWVDKKKVVAEDLHLWADRVGVPMLVGSIFYDHQQDAVGKYNSAILLSPDLATIDFYHKMHLVPFGEYVPFIETLPWLSVLTPYHGERVPSLSFGKKALCLPLGDFRLAVTICFEDTIPQVIARFFREAGAGRQPDVLINLSNDGWFHGSAELDMHLAIGVFRAVEHRVPLARAVNTGLTALIDGNGEIRASLPKESKGVLSVMVPLDDRGSFYTRYGDWLGLSCLAVTIGLVPLGIVRKPTRPRQQI
jgi:apolipoprotein N-acyltransferase